MDKKSFAGHIQMEQEIVQHVTEALRVALGWQTDEVGFAKRLSSTRFTVKSFQRHLERLFAMEEDGGYMATVGVEKPNLCSRIEALRLEHDGFREHLGRIVSELEQLSADDQESFHCLCNDLGALIDQVNAHERNENQLFQEAFLRDEGGEG